jgi:hypothetical protein
MFREYYVSLQEGVPRFKKGKKIPVKEIFMG